ncbi:methionine--tRNA ligase [Candidatus Woesearchaeota archaeon]|nr:methionine--tRNA ligase [Candidatus Woesearchaeota archaeon]
MVKYYITTAIDYVNAAPHIGHAYEKILADVLARWKRINNYDVFFLTGTDENAQKNVQAAKETNITTKKFVDLNSKKFIDLCKKLNISNDYFIKTSEKRHFEFAQLIFKKIYDNGDIYKKKYSGLYCVGCEAFLTEKDLVDGKCPDHNKAPKLIEEENYFFKLSKYEKQILKLVSSSDFIIPEGWRNEIVNRIKNDGLKDISVSRPGVEWGIDVPIDKEHKIYVWIDALSNYISALDYPNGLKFKKYWPADAHIVGKGINWFHSVIWPALLLSAKIELPKHIWVHGYVTVDGKKISKSLGNSIDPISLVDKYSVDIVRYTLLKDIPFNQDGDFSEKSLKERNNNELANDLGNLVSRTLSLCEKFYSGKITKQKDDGLFKELDLVKINKYMDKYELHNALEEIWKFIRITNKYVNDKEPWKNAEDRELVLYNILEAIRIISILISPFIPETSDRINKQINVKIGTIKDIKFGLQKEYKVEKEGILFNKIE